MPEHGKWVLACLEGSWPKLLGNKLADICRPAEFEDSELVVEIIDRRWEEALRGMKSHMLEKLRIATAGEIRAITFRRQSAVCRDGSSVSADQRERSRLTTKHSTPTTDS